MNYGGSTLAVEEGVAKPYLGRLADGAGPPLPVPNNPNILVADPTLNNPHADPNAVFNFTDAGYAPDALSDGMPSGGSPGSHPSWVTPSPRPGGNLVNAGNGITYFQGAAPIPGVLPGYTKPQVTVVNQRPSPIKYAPLVTPNPGANFTASMIPIGQSPAVVNTDPNAGRLIMPDNGGGVAHPLDNSGMTADQYAAAQAGQDAYKNAMIAQLLATTPSSTPAPAAKPGRGPRAPKAPRAKRMHGFGAIDTPTLLLPILALALVWYMNKEK